MSVYYITIRYLTTQLLHIIILTLPWSFKLLTGGFTTGSSKCKCQPTLIRRLNLFYKCNQARPAQLHHFNIYLFGRFETPTAVTLKYTIFRDVTPYIVLEVYRRFGGSHRLCLQGPKAGPASNKGSSDIDFFLVGIYFNHLLKFLPLYTAPHPKG
jgi:hypothetical protein